jgi:hypothetical protein
MMKQLTGMVHTNNFVMAVQAEEDVCKDFMEYQQQFYKPFKMNTIIKYHIFLSHHQDKKGGLQYYESDLIQQEEMDYGQRVCLTKMIPSGLMRASKS